MTNSPKGDLHRIAPSRTPWEAFRGTAFEQRFDDPEQKYLVLYASSQRVGCFIECLAYFRVDPDKPGFAELQDKFGNSFPEGAVPPKWCLNRHIQSAKVDGTFADVAQSGWIASLLKDFPKDLRRGLAYPWMDQSTIYQAKSRAITQWISRTVFENPAHFAGIYYTSKLGSDFSNWAIFEPRATILGLGTLETITETSADLLKACSLLGLKPPTGALTQPAVSPPVASE